MSQDARDAFGRELKKGDPVMVGFYPREKRHGTHIGLARYRYVAADVVVVLMNSPVILHTPSGTVKTEVVSLDGFTNRLPYRDEYGNVQFLVHADDLDRLIEQFGPLRQGKQAG